MPLNEKLSWTFAGITAASGGAVFMCDQMANTTDKRTQQILGAVLAFWCVKPLRRVHGAHAAALESRRMRRMHACMKPLSDPTRGE
jgi:hypothetical protein